MNNFKPGDKVVLINVDHYSDIMKQLGGEVLVVRSVGNDKCGCEIVCAGIPGEEGWFLRSNDLQLVPVPTTAKTQEDWDEVFANTRLMAAAPKLKKEMEGSK